MIQLPEGYICSECAFKRGYTWPQDHIATARVGLCPHCNQPANCCPETDWIRPGQSQSMMD